MTRPSDGPTYLYRAYDKDERLLYVGIAGNWARRWAQHSERSPWFVAVARLDIELHPTRAAARDAERTVCLTERPFHNIEHTDRETRPMRRQSKAERYFVRSFDHRQYAAMPEYQAVARAIDDAANRLGREEINVFDFEAILVNIARTCAYGDTCRICRDTWWAERHLDPGQPGWHSTEDYRAWSPVVAEVDGDSLVAYYRCHQGHVWRCSWSIDAPLLWL